MTRNLMKIIAATYCAVLAALWVALSSTMPTESETIAACRAFSCVNPAATAQAIAQYQELEQVAAALK